MEAVSYIFDNDCLFYSTREGFKRRKEENALEEDRISGLPDPLLLHILSFSQTKHAVRTTVLSKRWRCLWTSVPILDFQYRDIPNQFKSIKCMSPFVSFINHTLIFYQSPKIEKFRVRMDYKISFASDVDVWLLFATRKNVEELDLDFSDSRYIYSSDDDEAEVDDLSCYALPLYMLTNSSLVTLKLNNCVIEHRRMICWKSLKVLSLTELSLSNDLIRDILSGSPSLELLELLDCHRYDFVDIKSGRLRKLVINVYNQHLPLDSYTELKISAPNIQSLEISGYLNIEKVSFINCSSLVDAKLNFRLPSFPPSEEYPKILIALLEKLSHVEDITLGSWCLQVLSVLEENAPPCPLFNWVRLRIGAQISHSELPGMARLLAVTPVLDTLVIDMIFNHVLEFELELIEPHDLEPGNYWSSQEKKLEASLLNLKTVKIANFCGSEIAIETISFMLKNARRLEKMIIQRAKWMIIQRAKWVYLPQEESLRVAERLLSFPRCSSAAVVLLS